MLNNHKIILTLLLCLLMTVSLALAGCQPEDTGCTEHTDGNFDDICDVCGVKIGNVEDTTPKDVAVSFLVVDQDGEPIADAELIIQGKLLDADIIGTSDASGAYQQVLREGSYTVSLDKLPDYHIGGILQLVVKEGMDTVTLEVIDNTPTGDESNPFFLGESENTWEFEAGQTIFFTARLGEGHALVLEDADVELTCLGKTYTPDENGRIELRNVTSDPSHFTFAVSNKGEGRNIVIKLAADLGTYENPYAVELDTLTTAQVKPEQTVYYSWVATANGTLTVSSDTTINNIMITNMTSSRVSGMTMGMASTSLDEIKAGDVIVIAVTVVDSGSGEYDEVIFTLSFQEA